MDDLQDVTFRLSAGGTGRGRLAAPSPSSPHTTPGPGVLVLHEIMGLNDDMDRIAARFAAAGYVALAPDFFGAGVRPLCILRAIFELRSPKTAKAGGPFDILASAQRFLEAHEHVDPTRVGAVGFCMGGGFAVLHAASAGVGVVGTFYGDVPSNSESLRGIPPVVAGYGGRDRIFGPGAERLRAHLAELDVDSDIQIYPNAGHSYMSFHDGWIGRLGALGPMNVGFDEAAAEDSWERLLHFFEKHLSG